MKRNYEIPSRLLRFLSACLFGDISSYYNGLNETEYSELERQGTYYNMTVWFYRFLHDILPEGKRKKYQRAYQEQQVKALMVSHKLRFLYRLFAAHGLRFAPIKGADLTYRLYPDAALRTFSDLDILFHPDDCTKALDLLKENGWSVSPYHIDKHGGVLKTCSYHFAPHKSGQYILEPHYSLPNFKQINPYEIWSYTREYPDGNGQRVLSPEMNLLLLTRHAATRSYYHSQLPKLLTDTAMVIMNETIDFSKLHSMAKNWNLPYSGDLLAAFPEFFPVNIIDSFQANTTTVKKIRFLFEQRGILGNAEGVSLSLCRDEACKQVTNGLFKHFRAINSRKIRQIYHLPLTGSWVRLILGYICYICSRIWMARAWFFRNSVLRKYTRIVESIEGSR